MKVETSLGIALLALLPFQAAAEGLEPYVELRGGVSFLDDLEGTTEIDGFGEFEDEATVDTGFVIEAAVGATYGDYLRFELAPAYRRAAADEAFIESIQAGKLDGSLETFNVMANVFVEPTIYGFHPYLGGGVGIGILSADAKFDDGPDEGREVIDDTATTLAIQALAGVGYEVTESVMLTVGYAYVVNFNAEFTTSDEIGGGDFDAGNIDSHNVMLGLRYTF